MAEERFLNFAILMVAGIFLLLGLSMIFGGLFGRNRRGQYQVERLQAQRDSMVRALKGVSLIAVGALLAGVWFYFSSGTSARANKLEATPTVPSVTQTPLPTLMLLTPTVEPTQQATALPESTEPTQVPTDAPPPATPTPVEPEPTPTATVEPTATPIPYDAYVNVVGGLNMRSTPNGVISVLLPNGTGLTLLNEAIAAGDFVWQKVISETGDEGWVAEEFIEFSQ